MATATLADWIAQRRSTPWTGAAGMTAREGYDAALEELEARLASDATRTVALDKAWRLLRYLWTAEVAPVQFLRAQREAEVVYVRDCFREDDPIAQDLVELEAILEQRASR